VSARIHCHVLAMLPSAQVPRVQVLAPVGLPARRLRKDCIGLVPNYRVLK